MIRSLDLTTPAQAHRAMLASGAIFAVQRRDDALGLSFTYRVREGGDLVRCREILAHVKSRPAPFYEAFRAAVQDAAAAAERGAT